LIDVPFELWNLGRNPADTVDDYRMLPFIGDETGNGLFDLSGIDHPVSGGFNDPQTDRITWYDPVDRSPSQGGYAAWVSANGATGADEPVISNMVLVNLNGGNVLDISFPANINQLLPPAGTIFRILTTKPNTPADVFSFQSPSVQSGIDVQQSFARQIGVSPNPWVGSAAIHPYVQFHHLPARATIRIFNLAGHLVRVLEKNDPGQFITWNLTNRDNWQVASGVYVCHVEMPDLGISRILKLAVVQPQILFPH
jgi:hypothetical protein